MKSKIKYKVFCFIFLFSIFARSQTAIDLFDKANELYRESKYVESIKIYEEIESLGTISSELYYNLGNAYYKINKIAPSIYNYEKALKINPNNEDAAANLIFANRMSIDNIEELPKTILQNFQENYIQKLSYDQWAWLSVICSISTSLFFLFFYFSYIPFQKRIYLIMSISSILILVFSLLITFKEYSNSIFTTEAIIFSEKVDVKNAPTENSESIFELHEGTKILVLDQVDIWKKIKLSDGKIGWVYKEHLKEL